MDQRARSGYHLLSLSSLLEDLEEFGNLGQEDVERPCVKWQFPISELSKWQGKSGAQAVSVTCLELSNTSHSVFWPSVVFSCFWCVGVFRVFRYLVVCFFCFCFRLLLVFLCSFLVCFGFTWSSGSFH